MKRRWHWSLWAGLILVLAGVSSFPFLAQIPATRDFAWANLLLLSTGIVLLFVSLTKSFRQPELYRGKILGGVLSALSVLLLGFFAFGIFYAARIPLPSAPPTVAQKAPEFTLPDQTGKSVSLDELLSSAPPESSSVQPRGALLIFYRGHW